LHGVAESELNNAAKASTDPTFDNFDPVAIKMCQSPPSIHGVAEECVDLGLDALSQSLKVSVEVIGEVSSMPCRALIY
jgi:hypothetical protein